MNLPGIENKEQPRRTTYEREMVPTTDADGERQLIPTFHAREDDGSSTPITASEFRAAEARGERVVNTWPSS